MKTLLQISENNFGRVNLRNRHEDFTKTGKQMKTVTSLKDKTSCMHLHVFENMESEKRNCCIKALNLLCLSCFVVQKARTTCAFSSDVDILLFSLYVYDISPSAFSFPFRCHLSATSVTLHFAQEPPMGHCTKTVYTHFMYVVISALRFDVIFRRA